ncbi:hypothetical protein D1B33_15985 [Lysinibacillus yapensis]|uniref:DUF4367 domain-containing protein n=1 Tax=Ureibacillus yapensis TaxID=2304605 RepID=A0A396SA68_9BACL|nr:hypothetical protein [Lysinibacillus yapensis]RHW33241.1 hypothetical protein D1B33_15985 [Lysinibacillus yapensis]
MKRKWFQASACCVLLFALAGCGKTVEEQIDTGVASAQTVFEETPQHPNQTIGKIKLYVPSGFAVEETEDLNNLILKKGNESYLLFVNYYEMEDSNLHYKLLKNNPSSKIIKEQTVEFDGAFGFTAVTEYDEEQFELIVSSGGVKMSTISEDQNIDEKLVDMMTIVRSVDIVKENN